jgi:hypothetical protein
MRAARDFDLLKENQFDFGTSISFVTQSIASKYEPGAASTDDRIRAIRLAKHAGIRTWISVEPVVNPDEAIMVMKVLKPWVDYWKIGKLNHHPQIEKAIDWKAFLNKALSILDGKPVHIKKDLLAAAHT